jgi:hypothetical protein
LQRSCFRLFVLSAWRIRSIEFFDGVTDIAPVLK